MSTVRQIMDKYDPLNHGIHFAIHQSVDKCIATFYMEKQFDTKDVKFERWNSYVTNKTGYQRSSDLLSADVESIKEVAPDWIVLLLRNYEEAEQLKLFDDLL